MFRVMHHTFRRPDGHIPSMSAQNGRQAAKTAIETPCKCPKYLKPKTSSAKKNKGGNTCRKRVCSSALSHIRGDRVAVARDPTFDLCRDRSKFAKGLFEFCIQQASPCVQNPIKLGLDHVEFGTAQSKCFSEQSLCAITGNGIADRFFGRRNAQPVNTKFCGQNENRHKTAFKTSAPIVDTKEIGALSQPLVLRQRKA